MTTTRLGPVHVDVSTRCPAPLVELFDFAGADVSARRVPQIVTRVPLLLGHFGRDLVGDLDCGVVGVVAARGGVDGDVVGHS
jgi:hypothetical protein